MDTMDPITTQMTEPTTQVVVTTSTLQSITNLFEIAAAIAIILTAIFVYRQVNRMIAIRDHRKVKAQEYITKWNDLGFSTRRAWVLRELRSCDDRGVIQVGDWLVKRFI